MKPSVHCTTNPEDITNHQFTKLWKKNDQTFKSVEMKEEKFCEL